MIFHFLVLDLFLILIQKNRKWVQQMFETRYKCNIIKIGIRISVFT